MNMPLISCIVPIYNSEKYLKKCIDSIVAQTFKSFELILVDDGSSDQSPQICDEYSKIYPFVKVIHKKNEGVSSARNNGLDIAKGEYIYFCDSDDWIESDMFDKALKSIGANDILFFDVIEEKKNGQYIKHQISGNDSNQIRNGLLTGALMGWLPSCIIKKSVIGNIRFNSTVSICEDLLFLCELSGNIGSIQYLPYSGYHYNQLNENSACHMFTQKKAYEIVEVIEKIENNFVKSGDLHNYNPSIFMLKARMKIWILLRCKKLETFFFNLYSNNELYKIHGLSVLQRVLLLSCIKPLRFLVYLARLIKNK